MRFLLYLLFSFCIFSSLNLRAEIWDFSSRSFTHDDSAYQLQQIWKTASPQQLELLTELILQTTESLNQQRPLPGMELDALFSHPSHLLAKEVLHKFESIQAALTKEELNRTRSENLNSGKESFYPNSPLAERMAPHSMFPQMVHQLIVQFLLRAEISENPNYLKTLDGKKRYEHLRRLFLQQQNTTPGLPVETVFILKHKDHWPDLKKFFDNSNHLPSLHDYLDVIAEETAISLQLAYQAQKNKQWEKMEEFIQRAEIFIAGAYLAAGNHRSDFKQIQYAQIKTSGVLLAGAFASLAIGSLHQEAGLVALGSSITSLVVLAQSFGQLGFLNEVSKVSFEKNDFKKFSMFSKKRLRSWLPSFVRNYLDHQTSQKNLSSFWNKTREYMTYNFIPGNLVTDDSAYEKTFQINTQNETARNFWTSQNKFHLKTQEDAIHWFYQSVENLKKDSTKSPDHLLCKDVFNPTSL